MPLPHLDRPFDYLVPTTLHDDVQRRVAGAGAVRRPAGRRLRARARADTDHEGKLAFLERAVGAEPVLTAETTALFRAVADRWAGNFVDVVRLGVPPRHARAESRRARAGDRCRRAARARHRLRPLPRRAALSCAASPRRAARAVWSALPGEDWPAAARRGGADRASRPAAARWSSCPTPATSPGSTPR